MVHIAMHAFGKITLFFCAGAIFVATGKKNISEMTGIGRRMPVTMTAFFIGALSIIGMPPCGGFLSKWLLVLGALEADKIAILVVLLFSSLLNAGLLYAGGLSGLFLPSRRGPVRGPKCRRPPFLCRSPGHHGCDIHCAVVLSPAVYATWRFMAAAKFAG
jgi:multicomponent Na+:H+ antiporter subunit D